MDYGALAELVVLSLLGLSVLTFAVGFSFRLFLAPVIREFFDRRGLNREEERLKLSSRVEAVEDRLNAIEGGIDRLIAAAEFDRQLEAPDISGDRESA